MATASRTARLRSPVTPRRPERVFDTVAGDTPARIATSWIVGGRVGGFGVLRSFIRRTTCCRTPRRELSSRLARSDSHHTHKSRPSLSAKVSACLSLVQEITIKPFYRCARRSQPLPRRYWPSADSFGPSEWGFGQLPIFCCNRNRAVLKSFFNSTRSLASNRQGVLTVEAGCGPVTQRMRSRSRSNPATPASLGRTNQ